MTAMLGITGGLSTLGSGMAVSNADKQLHEAEDRFNSTTRLCSRHRPTWRNCKPRSKSEPATVAQTTYDDYHYAVYEVSSKRTTTAPVYLLDIAKGTLDVMEIAKEDAQRFEIARGIDPRDADPSAIGGRYADEAKIQAFETTGAAEPLQTMVGSMVSGLTGAAGVPQVGPRTLVSGQGSASLAAALRRQNDSWSIEVRKQSVAALAPLPRERVALQPVVQRAPENISTGMPVRAKQRRAQSTWSETPG